MHHILSGKDSFFANFNTINNFALGKNVTHVTQDCHARHTELQYYSESDIKVIPNC